MPVEQTPIDFHALSPPEFDTLLSQHSAWKARSETTHHSVHVPELTDDNSPNPIKCLLIGASMLERFKTTGASTIFGRTPLPTIFNAGVGGDKVANVVYRLGGIGGDNTGDETGDKKDTGAGLFHLLQQRGVENVIVEVGTNDLKKNKALGAEVLEAYAVLLEAMVRLGEGVKIIVVGITPRMDIKQEVIDESNRLLERLVERVHAGIVEREGLQQVSYQPPTPIDKDKHLIDHVHLNEEGYALHAEALLAKLRNMDVTI